MSAEIGFGVTTRASIPPCFCDACDEDSTSMIAQAEQYVQIVAGGFREFRRPYQPRHPTNLFDGPWMEIGYEWTGGAESGASADVRGEPFVRDWQAWPGRPPPR